MKVIIFGATGMVGQGVLRQCLQDKDITAVLAVGRTTSETEANAKLSQLAHEDLWNYTSIETDLTGYDACFFCIGTTSAAKSEKDYSHITYDLTLAAATTLVRLNPNMTFVYVSGMGADSTEQGKVMWARVRGKTENALLALPFKAVYIVRPAAIQPLDGIQSKTTAYQLGYTILKPLLPLLHKTFPKYVTTTAELGNVMITLARKGSPTKILESKDFSTTV
jgi:uncharacterized protein YbjT (DUF2867 family)